MMCACIAVQERFLDWEMVPDAEAAKPEADKGD